MGIKLGSLFNAKTISYEDLSGRVVIIDAYNVLHQFLASIRTRDGSPLMNSDGKVTSHLTGLLHRTGNLVEAGIKPVYSFDGKPHRLKARTLEERMKRKELAQKEWEEAVEAGDLARARSKAQQTGRLTEEMVDEAKELLSALGIPFVQAKSDGEAQASFMVSRGDGFAVGSQDFDCLLFGAPVLLRNLTSSEKRKLPGKQAYVKVVPKMLSLKESLEQLEISREQLVWMAVVMGTDFNEGVFGIGPKTALKMAKKHESLEEILDVLKKKDKKVPSLELACEVADIFLKPDVTVDYSLSWSGVDESAVLDLLVARNRFSKERVMASVKTFGGGVKESKQKNLFDF